jgi:hypothetical protein
MRHIGDDVDVLVVGVGGAIAEQHAADPARRWPAHPARRVAAGSPMACLRDRRRQHLVE